MSKKELISQVSFGNTNTVVYVSCDQRISGILIFLYRYYHGNFSYNTNSSDKMENHFCVTFKTVRDSLGFYNQCISLQTFNITKVFNKSNSFIICNAQIHDSISKKLSKHSEIEFTVDGKEMCFLFKFQSLTTSSIKFLEDITSEFR